MNKYSKIIAIFIHRRRGNYEQHKDMCMELFMYAKANGIFKTFCKYYKLFNLVNNYDNLKGEKIFCASYFFHEEC